MTNSRAIDTSAADASEGIFGFHDIFFSRTDSRGIILSGNATFQIVSGYEWSELLKKPHKVVRHPDMPKGLFHLFWTELKAGRPVGTYVVNLAKNGEPYWVFAMITPLRGGYISVRIKPSSPLFKTVQTIYAELLKREAEEKLSPEASSEALIQRLGELGYESYSAFATDAVSQELCARDKVLGRASPPMVLARKSMMSSLIDLTNEAQHLPDVLKQLKITQVNMGVLASRIEPEGGPITAIAMIYSQMTNEIGSWIAGIFSGSNDQFTLLREQVEDAARLAAWSTLKREVASDFLDGEIAADILDSAEEISLLSELADNSNEAAEQKIASVAQQVAKMSEMADSLKRGVTRLGSTRMICEVESARLIKSSESLEEVVNKLCALQDELEKRQGRIETAARAILSEINEVQEQRRRSGYKRTRKKVATPAPPVADLASENIASDAA